MIKQTLLLFGLMEMIQNGKKKKKNTHQIKIQIQEALGIEHGSEENPLRMEARLRDLRCKAPRCEGMNGQSRESDRHENPGWRI